MVYKNVIISDVDNTLIVYQIKAKGLAGCLWFLLKVKIATHGVDSFIKILEPGACHGLILINNLTKHMLLVSP